MAHQLNVFVENRPGRLSSVTDALSASSCNIRAFAIQDRGDYGLAKFVVNKPKDGQLALQNSGFACALKEIIAVSIPDKPGNLHKLAVILADNNVNLVDAYGFVLEPDKIGVCCLEIEGGVISDIENILKNAGFSVLTDEQLYEF